MFTHQSLQDRYAALGLSKTKTLFLTLDENGEEYQSASFDEVDTRAREIAVNLICERGLLRGDRVLLTFHPGEQLDFIKAFLGCIYAGLIAVPISPPNPSLKNSLLQMSTIAKDSMAKICIGSLDVIGLVKSLTLINREHVVLRDLQYIHVRDISEYSGDLESQYRSIEPASSDSDVIMLQYSSGSTGSPKGIMLTHKNIFFQCHRLMEFNSRGSNTVSLSWLPLFHDMGLMSSVFTALLHGPGLQILLSPLAFLKNPTLWLQIITKYGVHVSGGPNFAYAILSKKFEQISDSNVHIDLSSWQVAFCGAEPVRPSTIHDFSRIFKKYGFNGNNFFPVYGLGEATLLVSKPSTKNPRPATVLSVSRKKLNSGRMELISAETSSSHDRIEVVGLGYVHETTKFRVVNPVTNALCQEGEVGEFWISNESVAKGYWNKPQLTEDAFNAFTVDNEGPFLRSGDLGFMYKEELFFTSRLKDLIILDGVKHFPQDIELVVESSHPLVRKGRCAAFVLSPHSLDSQETLGVTVEVQKGVKVTQAIEHEMKQAIQKQLFQTLSFSPHIKNIEIIAAGSIPKTTSGKIQRHACRDQLQSKTLQLAIKSSKEGIFQYVFDIYKKLMMFTLFLFLLSTNYIQKFWAKSSPKYDNNNTKPPPAESKRDNEFQRKVNAMQQTLMSAIKHNTQIDLQNFSVTTPFFELGFSSVDAVQICEKLGGILGRKIPPTCLYEYYTVELLSKYLVDPDNRSTFKNTNQASFHLPTSLPVAQAQAQGQRAIILGMGVANPDVAMDQQTAMNWLLESSNTLKTSENLSRFEKLFESGGIKTRYFAMEPEELSKLDSVADRNAAYNVHAPALAARAARKAIENWGGDKSAITHVVSVSCTGTIVPGIEFHLVDDLDLDRNVLRLGVNFMGCFGGLSGLRTAQSIALSNPSHRVLLVCTELCSLQVQKDDVRNDNLVAESLFGDGAAAVIIGGSVAPQEHASFEILKATNYAIKNSRDRIQWDLSNTGWIVGLKHDIAHLLGQVIEPCSQALIGDLQYEDVDWCIHPGGKAIIQLIEEKLRMAPSQISSTWNIYQNYGNMSSATILFVLDDMRRAPALTRKEHIAGLAFGPGLSVEGMLFKRL
eukprot:Phypoly_transcript_01080.p1 GENE.Phypoly_transcript_01080~~Phypoly_transcript_01080.p1  ORF type:complete len:1118 (+),score=120.19 Phypoly_transcript_01080:154-3507(+)